MADLRTSSEHRLLQVFISKRGAGVFETYLHLDSGDLHCTCPGFRLRRRCKHTEYVGGKIETEGGYGVSVVRDDPAALTEEITTDPNAFRLWVIKNMKVMVL